MADLLDKVFKTNAFKMLKELKSRNVQKGTKTVYEKNEN